MLKVYLETSIPSYLTARPSRDLIIAARQQITREWWEIELPKHDVFVSEIVLEEASGGNADAARKRIESLAEFVVLQTTEEVRRVTNKLIEKNLIPVTALQDAAHIAMATVHEMNVLLTWNCAHIANPVMIDKINRELRLLGYESPIICTPDAMLEDK